MSAAPTDFAVGNRVRILSGVHSGVHATVTRIGAVSVGVVRDGETYATAYLPDGLRIVPDRRRIVVTIAIPEDETPAEYLETTSSITALIDYIAEHHDTVLVNVEETPDAR